MPKYLELKGQRLECNEVMPVGLFFDLAEAMDGENMIKAVAAMSKTVKAIVAGKDHPRLQKILYATDDPISFDQLNEALGNIIPEYTNRPTVRPSGSPPGDAATGGTSRRVSLSVVNDPGEEPPSSMGGRSAAS